VVLLVIRGVLCQSSASGSASGGFPEANAGHMNGRGAAFVVVDGEGRSVGAAATAQQLSGAGCVVPTSPRHQFRVGVVGARGRGVWSAEAGADALRATGASRSATDAPRGPKDQVHNTRSPLARSPLSGQAEGGNIELPYATPCDMGVACGMWHVAWSRHPMSPFPFRRYMHRHKQNVKRGRLPLAPGRVRVPVLI
jgi:hypothetical protein